MTYKLYLDDLRTPQSAGWVVVRSYDEAVTYVQTHGFPQAVSFDHDLGDAVPTGMDFARWLVEQDLDSNSMPDSFEFNVHSANPVGRDNINGLLTNYIKHKLGLID
jgi:hypothetical protein